MIYSSSSNEEWSDYLLKNNLSLITRPTVDFESITFIIEFL